MTTPEDTMSVAEPTGIVTPPPRQSPGQRGRTDPYDNPPPDTLFEVVNGVRVEKAMSAFEQYIAGILHERLAVFCRENDTGRAFVETKFHIPGSGNDRQPDAGFLSYDRWPKARGIPRVNAWPVAPDLVVEVISPTDRAFDVLAKRDEYFAGGVRAVWHVWSNVEEVHCWDSPSSVRILKLPGDLTGGPVLPGFRMSLVYLFPTAEPEPAADA